RNAGCDRRCGLFRRAHARPGTRRLRCDDRCRQVDARDLAGPRASDTIVPMRVTTRTFLRAKGGRRQFLEISWSDLEVETVTGSAGTEGRALSRMFETEVRRDAWIAKRVDKALREGYREGDPAEVPAPEPRDAGDDARAAARLRDTHGL